MIDLKDKSVLITGGTGSFGQEFIKLALENHPRVKKLVVFSRDELKQYQMALKFPGSKYPCLRYFIGDVRDERRLERALEGIDYVVHTAALKQVPTAEYNPFECIKTNVLGTQNVIEASFNANIKKVVALSTDKAAAPINLYGAYKLCSDKLLIAANNMKGKRDINFSVVRYGNVMGSRGSVMPLFLDKRKEGVLPITHPAMSRFNITQTNSAQVIFFALEKARGGEIFVPKIPSFKITDLAHAIGPDCDHQITGIRHGEKLHEEMITQSDSLNTIETKDMYIIVPLNPYSPREDILKEFQTYYNGVKVKEDFCYRSDNNQEWLSVNDLRELIIDNIDPKFKV